MDQTESAVTGNDHPKPQKPVEPDPLDCCGSGCARCVFDVYNEAVQRYREELAAWEEITSSDRKSGDA